MQVVLERFACYSCRHCPPWADKARHSRPFYQVLNERLRKLVSHDVFKKTEFPKIPPHVEYGFTELGKSFLAVLQQIEALERERAQQDTPPDELAAASRRQLRR